MKKVTTLFIALFWVLMAQAQADTTGTLIITVDSITEAKGEICYAVFVSQTDFLKKPVKSGTVKAEGKQTTITIPNLPFGEYAVSIYHDENSNGKMDFGMYNIPTEAFGFSNNAPSAMGPPKYDHCKLVFSKDMVTNITLTRIKMPSGMK